MPSPSASDWRNMSPFMREASFVATSSRTDAGPPAPCSTAVGCEPQAASRASASPQKPAMTRCCMSRGRVLLPPDMPNLLNAAAFTVCLAIGVGLFLRQITGRFNLLRAAKGTFSLDDLAARLRDLFTVAIGQEKFLR